MGGEDLQHFYIAIKHRFLLYFFCFLLNDIIITNAFIDWKLWSTINSVQYAKYMMPFLYNISYLKGIFNRKDTPFIIISQ